MNSDLLIRLIRAFYNKNFNLFERAIKSIILDEKKLKHNNVVKKIEDAMELYKDNSKSYSYSINNNLGLEKNLFELPKNPRTHYSLGTIINYENLRHHMILDKETDERFLEIEKQFSARIRLAKYNLYPKKKILLYGPPGCGKTMGAERIAWNIGLPLIKVNFDSLISSYLGETASNMRSIFEITKKSPCVLLLDECDIIAKSRILKQDVGEMSRIVNMLLLLLDEYNSDGLIIATTNLDTALDKAIYRRFDDIIQIKLPNKDQIYKIIVETLKIIKIDKSLDLDALSKKLEGMSSSNIVSIIENSIKLAILGGKEIVNEELIEKSLNEQYKPI